MNDKRPPSTLEQLESSFPLPGSSSTTRARARGFVRLCWTSSSVMPLVHTRKVWFGARMPLGDGCMFARIGVSDFSPQRLRQPVDRTEVVPAVNQVELFPDFAQSALWPVHAELGVITQAWSRLGGVLVYVSGSDESRMSRTIHGVSVRADLEPIMARC